MSMLFQSVKLIWQLLSSVGSAVDNVLMKLEKEGVDFLRLGRARSCL